MAEAARSVNNMQCQRAAHNKLVIHGRHTFSTPSEPYDTMSTLPLPMIYRCVPASRALNTVSPLANDTSCISTAICAVNTELQGAKSSVLLSSGNLHASDANKSK